MLTADLAINWRRGGQVFPRFIKTDDANYLRDAEVLIAIFDAANGQTRGALENELEEYVGTGTDYRTLRGFIKLLTDRAEFETSSIAPPEEIRRILFTQAKEFHPVFPDSEKRTEVLEGVAAALNTDSQTVFAGLYADLAAQQRLKSFQSIAPLDLLDRYNLAQAQALLYKCVEMKIWIEPQTSFGYRQIFNAIKHFRLIHSISGNPTNGYFVTLTGAASIFHRSQKYGIQMSVFLPALLNCTGWRMTAEISLKDGDSAIYELESRQTQLSSCYFDEPEYENPIFERLKKDWVKSATAWQLEENMEVVDLGKTAFIPDFVLKNTTGAKIYLDILGFWTPKSLHQRLAEFANANFRNFIIGAWEELRGSRDEVLISPQNVVLFKSKLDPHLLEITAEKLTDGEKSPP